MSLYLKTSGIHYDGDQTLTFGQCIQYLSIETFIPLQTTDTVSYVITLLNVYSVCQIEGKA